MPLEEIVLAAIADAAFGFAFDKGGSILESWKSERDVKKAFKEALGEAFALFSQKEPEWGAQLFDESFFQHEGKFVLAQFLVRDGRPDPAEPAERWANSLNMRSTSRRMRYVRELEPVAATFLDSPISLRRKRFSKILMTVEYLSSWL